MFCAEKQCIDFRTFFGMSIGVRVNTGTIPPMLFLTAHIT